MIKRRDHGPGRMHDTVVRYEQSCVQASPPSRIWLHVLGPAALVHSSVVPPRAARAVAEQRRRNCQPARAVVRYESPLAGYRADRSASPSIEQTISRRSVAQQAKLGRETRRASCLAGLAWPGHAIGRGQLRPESATPFRTSPYS